VFERILRTWPLKSVSPDRGAEPVFTAVCPETAMGQQIPTIARLITSLIAAAPISAK
jgi:hypothetical protein